MSIRGRSIRHIREKITKKVVNLTVEEDLVRASRRGERFRSGYGALKARKRQGHKNRARWRKNGIMKKKRTDTSINKTTIITIIEKKRVKQWVQHGSRAKTEEKETDLVKGGEVLLIGIQEL